MKFMYLLAISGLSCLCFEFVLSQSVKGGSRGVKGGSYSSYQSRDSSNAQVEETYSRQSHPQYSATYQSRCEQPSPPMNGRVSCRQNENRQQQCVGTCMAGYKFPDDSESMTLECSMNGVWLPFRNFPDCVGSYSGSYGSSQQSSYRNEYSRQSSSHSSYGGSSRGSGYGSMSMQRVECEPPRSPANGRMACNMANGYWNCPATCNPGYAFPDGSTQMTLTCSEADGVWNPQAGFPDCTAFCHPACEHGGRCWKNNQCQCPPSHRGNRCQYAVSLCDVRRFTGNSYVQSNCTHLPEYTECHMVCPPGMEFRPPTSSLYRCTVDGHWNPPTPPQCASDSLCNTPPAPMNGHVRCTGNSEVTLCSGTCMNGFFFPEGFAELTIQCVRRTGRWSPDAGFPNCEASCSPPCENRGKCLGHNSCLCPRGYRGGRCQYRTADCDGHDRFASVSWNCNHGEKETTCNVTCPTGASNLQPAEPTSYTCSLDGKWHPDLKPICVIDYSEIDRRSSHNEEYQISGSHSSGQRYSERGETQTGHQTGYNFQGQRPVDYEFGGQQQVDHDFGGQQQMNDVFGRQQEMEHEFGGQQQVDYDFEDRGRMNLGGYQEENWQQRESGYSNYGSRPTSSRHDKNENLDVSVSKGNRDETERFVMEEKDAGEILDSLEEQEEGREDIFSKIEVVSDYSGVCTSWGYYHFRSFDGGLFTLPSSCPYVIATICEPNSERVKISLMTECDVHGPCTRTVGIEIRENRYTLSFEYGLMQDGITIPIPAQAGELAVERITRYIVARLTVGFTIWLNEENTVLIVANSFLKYKTCGICGNFDSQPDAVFLRRDGTATGDIYSFAESWRRDQDGNCVDNVELSLPCSSDTKEKRAISDEANVVCAAFLNAEFRKCSEVIDPSLYYAKCQMDCCSTQLLENCECPSIAEFMLECSRNGIEMGEWRKPGLCPIKCSGGMVYKECGPSCPSTCDDKEPTCQQERCVDGCHCPEGTVLEDDQCVAVEECPCHHGEKVFRSGERMQRDCNTCICQGGSWQCTDSICAATCTVSGPHYTTFDGLSYDLYGMCSYYLVEADTYNVQIEYSNNCRDLTSLTSVCVRSITIQTEEGATVKLKQTMEVSVNGREMINLPVSAPGIYVGQETSVYIRARLNNGLEILWDMDASVQVYTPASLFGTLRGLCGTFTHSQQDDLLTPEGDVELTTDIFAPQWRVDESCPMREDPRNKDDKPCDQHSNRRAVAARVCGVIEKEDFEECHSFLDYQPYYEKCMEDVCGCLTDPISCTCLALSEYASACAKKGKSLTAWRQNTQECGIPCPVGQIYQACASPCSYTCAEISHSFECRQEACTEGCTCPPGQTLDMHHKCVQVSSCSCVHSGHMYPPEFVQRRGKQMCECSEGIWDCHEASPSDYLLTPPPNIAPDCDPAANMELTDCVSDCPVTCTTLHHHQPCTTAICVPGCRCKEGFVLDSSSNSCVRPIDCPCHHSGKSYEEGEQVVMECHTCTCEGGIWLCPTDPCPGICSTWGDSHFETFDGKLFDFVGPCDYVLTRAHLPDQKIFSVVVQNVPCGAAGGATCGKSVSVTLGHQTITMTRDHPLPTVPAKFRLSASSMGMFTLVDSDIGITVQWDKNTRVYIIAQPIWKNKLQGLCGDFNSDATDDFRGPSGGLPLVLAKDFADSWRVHKHCNPATQPKNACDRNPERRTWSRHRCSVLKSELFKPCHYQVQVEEYFKRCVQDACACNAGGDCECMCAVVSAYAQKCARTGVVIPWRSQDLCPVQCESCDRYSPCITLCPAETCDTYLEDPEAKAHSCSRQPCVDGCEPKPCDPGYVHKSATNFTCVPVEECSEKPCAVINGRPYREGERIQGEDAGDKCQSCYCRRGDVECVGVPCTSTTPRPTVGYKTEACEYTGWTEWINSNNPHDNLGDDVEDLVDLIGDHRIPCPLANISTVQCRVADTQEPYQATNQDVLCDFRKGLQCKRSVNRGGCKDYEIKVYCQCHHEVTCPPGQHWDECAFDCSNVCHSMRTYLDEEEACSHGQKCVPGCTRRQCYPPKRSRDAETCVATETCTCRLRSGYVLAPGEVITDGCQKCQCLNNSLICSTILDCTIVETELPAVPLGVTEIEYITSPYPGLCHTGWTQWQSLNSPNRDGEKESLLQLFGENLVTCKLEQIVRIQCRETKSLQMVERSGQNGAYCDAYNGLVCINQERAFGGPCPDFEIRVYCDCDLEIVPGWLRKTTTEAPFHITETTTVTLEEKVCYTGWSEWLNNHLPDRSGERETISSLVNADLISCEREEITRMQCREVKTQREISQSLETEILCDHLNEGLVCINNKGRICPDYEVRVYCQCKGGRGIVKPAMVYPTTKATTLTTRHEIVTVTLTPPHETEEEEILPALPGIRPTPTACSYWSDWINKGKPRKGKKHGDREDTKPYILKQTEGFCLEGAVSEIECRHVETDKDYRESGEERLVCSLDSGFQCQNRFQPDKRCDDYKIRYYCTCGEEEGRARIFIKTTTSGYVYECSELVPLIDGPKPLPDFRIRASSSASHISGPDAIKMNNRGRKAWTSAVPNARQYIEVDLGDVRAVYGIVTKGKEDSDEFVTSYQLLYSIDGASYSYYQEGDKNKVFSGNYDDNVEVQHIFRNPFEAKLVRVEPLTWEGKISMRLELLGCAEAITTTTTILPGEEEEEEHEVPEECRLPIGIETEGIDDSRLSASSFLDPETSSKFGRMGSDTAWVAGHIDDQQYFQVDVSDQFTITGIVTRGRADEPQWVRSYTVSFLADGVWQEVKDEDGEIKEFSANFDQNTKVTNELPDPIDPQIVRIFPTSWKGWMSMQVELLGCPREEEAILTTLSIPVGPKCDEPMGLENGLLLDSQLSATSSYSPLFTPEFSRLGSDSVWASAKLDETQYLQVDFIDPQNVSGIITKGREDIPQWVTAFEVEFSNDGNIFNKIRNNRGGVQEFSANYDPYHPVQNLFPLTIRARVLRIIPTKWKNWISMQIEVLGCYHPSPCRDPMGVENGVISDHQLTASSEATPQQSASNGRLSSVKAWSPNTSDKNPYIQVDLLEPTSLSGIITKGNPESQQWVKAYQVSFSNDTGSWKKVEKLRGGAKEFQGNEDQDSAVINLFPFPFTARYVRIRPLDWHRAVSMRFELLGCFHEKECREPMGLENGMVSDSQITASSSADYESIPGRARISSKGGWQPGELDKHPYLQIDFIEPRSVSAVVTKGKGDSSFWVKRFKVTYSFNQRQWYPIITEDGDDVTFEANEDPDTPVINLFPDGEIEARMFRIIPLAFNEAPGLRVEMLGCYHPYECREPMGMADGGLLDFQLTASSSMDEEHSPSNARLDSQTAWVIDEKDNERFIQVDFVLPTNVSGLMTQGRNDGDEWVKEFKVKYSMDGEIFMPIGDENGDPLRFDANYDSESTVTNLFPSVLTTRFLRIIPTRYYRRIAMRLEVIGCFEEKKCLEPMGLENGLLPDSYISASSYKAEDTRPEYVRLNSEWSWAAKRLDKDQYIEVDFLEPRNISAIVTKGDNKIGAWVTKYKVAISDDGIQWTFHKNEEGDEMEFDGNTDNQTPVIRILPEPVEARVVRIVPTEWFRWISLRLEILGCYHPYEETVTEYVTGLPEGVLPMTGLPTEPIMVEACPDPMEAENTLLIGSKITVSSSTPGGGPSQVALNTPEGGWVPRVDDLHPVLTIEFPDQFLLTSIFIQGHGGKEEHWVTSLRVVESSDNITWMPVFGPDGREEIQGNTDKNRVVGHYFKVPVKTKLVRIIPEKWHRWPSFRIDLRGCRHLPGASTPLPAVLHLCPELVEYPELADNCPDECPAGQLCDGQKCTDPVDCSCVHQGEIFNVGDRLVDRQCHQCACALGGHSVCNKKECEPCEEDEISIVQLEDCSCSCEACPEGLRICPNSGECVPEQRWCDGIIDCPDDETNCEHTTTQTPVPLGKYTTKVPLVPPGRYTTTTIQTPVPLGRYTTKVPPVPPGRYTTTTIQTPTGIVSVAPGFIVPTIPPELGNFTCDIIGRHINTFDGQDIVFEICHHVAMKDIKLGKFNVTLHKECGFLAECRNWLEVYHRKHHLVVHASTLQVELNGHVYTGAQLWRLHRKAGLRQLLVSKAGEQVRIKSLQHGFTVIYDVRGHLKIEVLPELQKKISGLCGYFSGDPSDDQRKPNGRTAFTAQEFGDSWTTGDRQTCVPLVCPHEQMAKAMEICHKLKEDPFVACGKLLPLNQYIELCMSSACECLLGKLRKNNAEEEQKCKCEAFLPFVEACEAKLGPLIVRNWRIIHECHTKCSPGMEWQDCGPSCQLTCESAGVSSEDQTAVSLAEECSSDRCVPGCFCPPGTVLNDDQCIPPDRCADQVCRGFGDPHFRTFDGLFFPLQATGSFLIVGDKDNDISVSGLSKKCSMLNPNTCLVGLKIQYKRHTISIQKKKELEVDNRKISMDKLPLHEDGLVILGYPGRTFVVVIPAIRFEARYYEENSGFAVKVPSRRYFNKTEGLCGNCNGRRDDELKQEPINEYICSWKTDGDKEECIESLEDLPEIETRLLICDTLQNPVFGGCHALVDVDIYVDACNFDATHSGDERASLCKTAMEYGRQCCQAGVDVVDWPGELGCDIDCPAGTKYESCHRGCPQTCVARNNRTTSPDEDCTRTKTDGCFCPEGEILKDDTCVPISQCDTCDEEGHVPGDKWKVEKCKNCECNEDKTVQCVVEVCPATPICSVHQQLDKQEAEEGESCCDTYVCVPKEEDCPRMEIPHCRKGEVAKVHTGFDRCPRYRCECDPVLCPVLVWPEDLEEGQRSVLINDSCCSTVQTICDKKECPEKPDCPDGTNLIELESECCDIFKCRPPKDVCTYSHAFEITDGIQSFIEQIAVGKTVYQPGEEWEDGLCVKCSCVESNGQFVPQCLTEQCPELQAMLDNKDYVLRELQVPGKCCPDIFKVQCRDEDGDIHEPGEEWQDDEDPCITFLCEQVEDGSVTKTKSIMSCPECPKTAVLFPPSKALGQCCGVCKVTRCEEEGHLYLVGETWTLQGDVCKVAECISEFGNVKIIYTRQSCPIIPNECPQDKIIWDSKGCCQICNLTSEVACSTGPIPEQDTVGFFTFHDPLRDWVCVNDKPVPNVLQCKGACHSRAYYSLEDGDFKEMCQCCKVDVTVDRTIELRCPDGSYIRKNLLQPQSCKCSKCAPKDKSPSQPPWDRNSSWDNTDEDAFVIAQQSSRERYKKQQGGESSWNFQQQEQQQEEYDF